MQHLMYYKMGEKPTKYQLLQNQLCINTADKKMYAKNLYGEIIQIGCDLTADTVIGEFTLGEIADGAMGDGSDIATPITVGLTFSSQVFMTSTSGVTTPSTITLLASVQGIGTPTYTWYKDDVLIVGQTTNMLIVSNTDIPQGTSSTYKVVSSEFSDSVTLTSLVESSGGISPILTNEAHVISARADGSTTSTDYTGSGTDIIVYKGTTKLTYTSSTTPNVNEFHAVATTATSITVGTKSNGVDYVRYDNHSAMILDTASIVYTIYYNNNGVTNTITKSQTFAKANEGVDGSAGATGARGAGFYTRAVSGMAAGYWSDSQAELATPGASVAYDVVTLYNPTTPSIATTKYYTGSAWATPALMVHGDMIVSGTIVASRVVAGHISTVHTKTGDFYVNATDTLHDPASTAWSYDGTSLSITNPSDKPLTYLVSLGGRTGYGATTAGYHTQGCAIYCSTTATWVKDFGWGLAENDSFMNGCTGLSTIPAGSTYLYRAYFVKCTEPAFTLRAYYTLSAVGVYK